ncbi:MAG TPA: hypothetical protein QKA14_00220 [Candidatus Megaira endosymbiont of Hartmannula sinica]|nr:hypothetical protein [Candidatus Megaera endosymbiont of Hartmannula sinica]
MIKDNKILNFLSSISLAADKIKEISKSNVQCLVEEKIMKGKYASSEELEILKKIMLKQHQEIAVLKEEIEQLKNN